MNFPQDPFILLSLINTNLRDKYPSFDELCKSECVDESKRQEIENKLENIGYKYNKTTNSFK